MSTEAQSAASRANSLLSTGPKTPEGKAKMFANPLRHGLTSAHLIIPGEREEDFLELLEIQIRRYAPVGYAETTYVQQIAEAHWRLFRVRRAETELLSHLVNETMQENGADAELILGLVYYRHHAAIARIHRYETAITRQLNKAERSLVLCQKDRHEQAATERLLEKEALRGNVSSVSQNLQNPVTAALDTRNTSPDPLLSAGSVSQHAESPAPDRTLTRAERRHLRHTQGKKAVKAALANLSPASVG